MALYQTKKLLHSKGNHQQNENEWKEISANGMSDNELITKYIKNSYNPITKEKIIWLKMDRETE